MSHHYATQIVWSEEDGAYIAHTLELPGGVADGATPEEALANLNVVIEEWLEVAKEEEREIPEPMTQEDISRQAANSDAELRRRMQQEIQNAALAIVEQIMKEQQRRADFGHRRMGFNPEPLVGCGGR